MGFFQNIGNFLAGIPKAYSNGANPSHWSSGSPAPTASGGPTVSAQEAQARLASGIGSDAPINLGNQTNPYNPNGTVKSDVLGASSVQAAPTSAPANPNAVQAPTYPDKSNDIALQQAGLSATGTQRTTALQRIQEALKGLLSKYDTEASSNQANYTQGSTTNTNNFLKNTQAALVNAAQGRQGLFGTLSSLGALSGSGIDLANQAVQQGANADIAGGQDTFSTNQTALNTGIDQFNQQNEARKKDAQSAASDAQANAENQILASQQKLYSNIADDYAAMGDKVNAAKYAQLAASLFPSLATTSVPATSNIAFTPASYTPATLGSYIAGSNTPQVSTSPADASGLPGLFAAPGLRRRDQVTA